MKASRLLVATAASLVCAGAALAQPAYTITDLGRPGTNNVGHADAISTSGNYVVGRGVVGNNNAWVYDRSAGTNTILTPLSGYANNWAIGVNDSGTIVGMASTSASLTTDGTAYGSAVPVVWKNGTATTLAASGRVYGINSAGIAVGSSGTIGAVNQRAVVYDTNTLTTSFITTQTDYGASMKTATGINDSGLVIGTGSLGIDTGALPFSLLYNPATDTMTTIATASVGGSVTATDINNSGQVVGTITNNLIATPYLWSAAGGMKAVPLPTGMVTGYAIGINDSGWIVGNARNSGDANYYGFVDIAGKSYLLSNLIADATGWTMNSSSYSVTGISNDGTISGYTYFTEPSGSQRVHAFELNVAAAVPEPSSYALLLGGLLAVGTVVRRRKNA